MDARQGLQNTAVEALARIAREERAGQIEMVRAVADTIDEGGTLVVEAPTGTGKSFGFLVPAILSGRRTVVLTATKSLQDQLAGKDLPFLRERLGVPFDYAVLKGRGNYVCLQRVDEACGVGTLMEDVPPELEPIVEWMHTTTTGDVNELALLDADTRRRITVTTDECPGMKRCDRGADCWAEQAKHRARSATVVVANMALYGNDLATGGMVLPDHELVVVDEAHRFEDAIAESLGAEVSAASLRRVSMELGRLLDDSARPLIERVAHAGQELTWALEDLGAGDDKLLRYPLPEQLQAALIGARVSLVEAIRTVEALGETDLDTGEWFSANQRATRVWVSLQRLHERVSGSLFPTDSDACFVEGEALRIVPLDVSEILREQVWTKRAAVLTSATIPINLTERVGCADARRITVESPFDFAHNALLYLDKTLPPVNDQAWAPAAYAQMAELINAAGGRTLALFSSYRAMRDAAAALRRRGVQFPILTQDEGSKASLVERFAADERTCLFATQGFYEGVDIPGRTLSLVIIDRIPFPHRNDPLMTARSRAAGSGGWFRVDMPKASTLLTQAAGRLIRTTDDRGVVAILDNRLRTKWESYGHRMFGALPPMQPCGRLDEACAFLRRITADETPPDPETMTSAEIAALVGAW